MHGNRLVDITLHVDKDTDTDERQFLEHGLRRIDGVVSVHIPGNRPHLITIEYDPDKTQSAHLLDMVQKIAGHSEMIGL